MTSYSRPVYQAVSVRDGQPIGPEGDYETAACEALYEEASRFQAIDDVFYDTPEECDAAIAECRVEVRYIRNEKPTVLR